MLINTPIGLACGGVSLPHYVPRYSINASHRESMILRLSWIKIVCNLAYGQIIASMKTYDYCSLLYSLLLTQQSRLDPTFTALPVLLSGLLA